MSHRHIVIIGLLLALVSAVIIYREEPSLTRAMKAALARSPLLGERFQVPDYGAMRAYRASRLTDQQLTELHRKSIEDYERHKQQQAEDGKAFWAARDQRMRMCESDLATKLRQPGRCYEPLPIGSEDIGKPTLGWETPEQIFEERLMGYCRMADSVSEARRSNCLPPK